MASPHSVGLSIGVIIGLCILALIVWVTMPEPADPCSPYMIERYTNDLIAYRDCKALGEQCLITPNDTHKYNSAQTSFDACVAKAVE